MFVSISPMYLYLRPKDYGVLRWFRLTTRDYFVGWTSQRSLEDMFISLMSYQNLLENRAVTLLAVGRHYVSLNRLHQFHSVTCAVYILTYSQSTVLSLLQHVIPPPTPFLYSPVTYCIKNVQQRNIAKYPFLNRS